MPSVRKVVLLCLTVIAAFVAVIAAGFAVPATRGSVVRAALSLYLSTKGLRLDSADIEMGHGLLTARSVAISEAGQPFLSSDRVSVAYGAPDRELGISAIRIDRPHLTVRRAADGSYDVARLFGGGGGGNGSHAPLRASLAVTQGRVDVLNPFSPEKGGRAVALDDVALTATIDQGAISRGVASMRLLAGARSAPVTAGFMENDASRVGRASIALRDAALAPVVDLLVSSSAFAIQDGTADIAVHAYAAGWDPSAGPQWHVIGSGDIRDAVVRTLPLSVPIRGVRGPLAIFDGTLEFPGLRGAASGVPIAAAGFVELLPDQRLGLRVDASGPLARVRTWLPVTKELPLRGPIALAASLAGAPGQPHVDIELRGRSLQYGAVPIDDLRTDFYYHDGHVAVRDTHARYGRAAIFGYGDIDLTASPVAGQFVTLLRTPSAGVPWVADVESKGITSASLVLSGPLMRLAGSGFGITSGGEQRIRAEAVASQNGLAVASIVQDHRGGELFANGALDRTGERPVNADIFARAYAVRLNGARVELSGMTRGAVGLPQASGALTGYASVRGTLAHLLGAVRVTGREVAVGGQPIGNVYVGAAGTGDAFKIARLAVDGPQARLESDGVARLVPRAGGRNDVAAALEGTAHVDAGASPLARFVRGRADAGFDALIDGGTWVASVDAMGPGATVMGTPVHGVRAVIGRSGQSVVVYGASADAAGGHIDALGTLPGAAAGDLALSARDVDAGALRAAGVPLTRGTVVALAQVSGTAQRPAVDAAAALEDATYAGHPLSGDAQAVYRAGAVQVRGGRIVAAGSVANVDGTIEGVNSPGATLALDASVPEADLGALGAAAGGVSPVGGVASAQLHATGTIAQPVITGEVASDVGTLRGVTYTGMRAALTAGRGSIDIRSGGVTFGGSRVAVQGDIDTSGADLRVMSPHVDLNDFNDFFNGKDVLEGHGAVDVTISTHPAERATTGAFRLADAAVMDVPLGDVTGRLHPVGRDVGIAVRQRSAIADSSLDLVLSPRLPATSVRASGTVDRLDLGALSPYVGLEDQRIAGIARAQLHGSLSARDTRGDVAFVVDRASVRGRAVKTAAGEVAFSRAATTVRSLRLVVDGAEVRASGTLHRDRTIDAHAVANVTDLHALEQYSTRPISMYGSAVASVDARGPIAKPSVRAKLDAGRGAVENVAFDSVQADAALQRGNIIAHGGVNLSDGHGTLRFGATLPVQTTELRIGPNDRPISIDAAAGAFGVAALDPFLHQNAATRGTLDGSVAVRGTVGKPLLSGKLALRDVSVSSKYDRVPITGLNADLDFANDRVDVSRLHGVVGSGTIDFAGSAHVVPATAFRPSAGVQYAFHARLAHADVDVPDYLTGSVDGALGLTKSGAVPYLYGTVGFQNTTVPFASILALASGRSSGPQPGASFPGLPPLQPHHIVVYAGSVFGDDLDHVLRPTPPPTPEPKTVALLPHAVALGLHVSAGKDVGVTGLLNVTGTGTLNVTGDTTAPQIAGTLTAVRGRAGFLSTQFDLLDGFLTFHPKEGLIPTVSADAITRTEDADITVSVYGRVDQLHTDLQSDPPMNQEAIVATLLRIPQLNSALASSQGVQQSSFGISPQNVVTGALAGQILGALNIGLERVFNLEEVTFGLDPLGHPTLELRKQVSPRSYTLYRTTFTVPPAQAFGIAYQVRRALQVEFTQSQTTPGALATYAVPQTSIQVKVTFH